MSFRDEFKDVTGLSPEEAGTIIINPLLGAQAVASKLGFEKTVIDPLKESQAAQEEVFDAQRSLNELRSAELESQRLRSARNTRLVAAQRARDKRIGMAETIAGSQVGIMNSTPVDGTDLSKNRIPTLDPVDDMGNTIPEV